MFDLLKSLVSKKQDSPASTGVKNQENIKISACVLLLEAALADNECTDAELDHVLETLKSQFDLSEDAANELVELAHCEREDALDLWQFTNQINQQAGKEEKTAVMEAVWRIVLSDGQLEGHEDHFAHKLANLLRLTHSEMIDAKINARKQIA